MELALSRITIWTRCTVASLPLLSQSRGGYAVLQIRKIAWLRRASDEEFGWLRRTSGNSHLERSPLSQCNALQPVGRSHSEININLRIVKLGWNPVGHQVDALH